MQSALAKAGVKSYTPVTFCHALNIYRPPFSILAYHLFYYLQTKKNSKIMDALYFTKVNLNFHQMITLIDRDDGNKKNKTLEKEAGLPSV